MYKIKIIIFITRLVNMLMKGRRVVYERYNSNARQCIQEIMDRTPDSEEREKY